MRHLTSRFRNTLLVLALVPAACASLRDQAVPGCPHCGDPLTLVGPGGRAEVVSRWRLAAWNAVPDAPAGAVPTFGDRGMRAR